MNVGTKIPNAQPTRLATTAGTSNGLKKIEKIRIRLEDALKGKQDVVQQVLVCLLARGHLLLEDRPGLGKTTLAKALASSVGGRFSRLQCTPDLLPSDITGFSIFNAETRQFEFRSGPVFSEVLLADEINRATPRTQSALLEAMAERQVTVDGKQYQLSSDFFVIATQNPHEQHGTYPLPEAQLDRFTMKLSVGYPAPDYETAMLAAAVQTETQTKESSPSAILTAGELDQIQDLVTQTRVGNTIQQYLVALATASRNHPDIDAGLSPRGLLLWQRAAQATAQLAGRDFVTPDDVQQVAFPVLAVRLDVEAADSRNLISQLLESVDVPTAPAP
jgi:MoxR-like ATPase|tara:strand:+ start:1535 stop:2533 length:999 start_codon:yes stop_codon:yes gene_type:complete